MSASTTAVAPPNVQADRVAPKTILALSITEAKRLLRHPVLLAGVALGAWVSIRPWMLGEPTAQDYETQIYTTFLIYWAPLYFAAFIAANTAALRERESTTAEMFRSAPTRYSDRTFALLAAGLVPTTLAAVLATVQLVVIADVGGITVGNQRLQVTPVVEMALVPATTAAAFACGVALARTVRSRALGAILAAVVTYMFFATFWAFYWFPGYFLTPYASSLHTADLGQEMTVDELAKLQMVNAPSYHERARWQVLVRDIDLVGWHIVYLIGLALLLAAYAVWRSGRDRRARWLLLPGAALTIGGLALQMATFGGPFDWWGPMYGAE
jgi:hypothetical protein